MNLTYEQRKNLETLSTQVYSSKSRWRKLVRLGIPQKPVIVDGKQTNSSRRYPLDYESVKIYLLELKETQEKMLSQMKKSVETPTPEAKTKKVWNSIKSFAKKWTGKADG